MTTRLTPYDTGDRLEPHPWPIVHTEPGGSAIDRDHYGYVDLDNDESATVFTIVGKRPDNTGCQPIQPTGHCAERPAPVYGSERARNAGSQCAKPIACRRECSAPIN